MNKSFVCFVGAITSSLALTKLDDAWHNTVDRSFVLAPLKLLHAPQFLAGKTQQIGTLMQSASFLVCLLLMVCLGLPFFAEDKGGLAIIAGGGLALWLLGKILGGKESRVVKATDILVLLYFALNIIAACASHYFVPSLKGLSKAIIYIASYFWFTSVLAQSEKRKKWVFIVMALTGMAVSLYGLYQYKIGVAPLATWEDPTVDTKTTRIYSTLRNPNLLAGFLIPLLPVSLSLGAMWLSKGRLWIVAGISALGVFAATLAATFLTGSRGGYMGVFAVVGAYLCIALCYFWKQQPKIRVPLIIGTIGLAACLLVALHFLPGFEQRVTSIFAGREHSSNSFRMNVYIASWKMFLDNWWFGVGPGNQTFRLSYGLYMRSGFDALGTYCVPLEVAVELGVGGLAVFLALVLNVLAKGHEAFWAQISGNGSMRWLYAGCAAAVIGLMVHGLVDTVFYRPQVHFLFWMFVAILTTAPKPSVLAPELVQSGASSLSSGNAKKASKDPSSEAA